MSRPQFESFKGKALKRTKVRNAYEKLAPAYELRRKLLAIRQSAGLTQEQVAERMHTSKSNISRLENVNSDISPRLSTISSYAAAVGYDLKIDFVRRGERGRKKSPNENG